MALNSNPTTAARRRYYWHFGISMSAYAIVLILSRWLLLSVDGRWQIPIALFPLIPISFVFASIVRFFMATDELQREIAVNSLALAGGATALIAISYGLLERGYGLHESRGLPPPSAWWTYGVFMGSWIVAGYFVRRRYR